MTRRFIWLRLCDLWRNVREWLAVLYWEQGEYVARTVADVRQLNKRGNRY